MVGPSYDRRRCCSKLCAMRMSGKEKKRSTMRTCTVCGKEFLVYPGDQDHRACSQECYFKSGRNTGRTKTHLGYNCKGCGKYVKLSPHERPAAFCSEGCLSQWQKTRTLSPATCAKIGERFRQRWADPVGRKKMLASMSTPEARANRLAAIRAVSKTPELRAKRSINATRLIADRPPKRGWCWYTRQSGTRVHLRSMWEHDFAERLDQMRVSWEYEPERFILSNGRAYTPDFRVETPFGECLVEIHRMKHVHPGGIGKIEKIALASKELPLPLVIIDEEGIRDVQRAVRRAMKERLAGAC